MKTTIWAFAFIITVMIIVFAIKPSIGVQQAITAPADSAAQIAHTSDAGPATSQIAQLTSNRQVEQKFGKTCANPASWKDVNNYIDDEIAFRGPVINITQRKDVRGEPTWIEIGAGFPNAQRVTLVIWGSNRSALEAQIANLKAGDDVCVIGRIDLFRGNHQVEISDKKQIDLY